LASTRSFTIDLPQRRESTRIFLQNAAHAAKRLGYEGQLRRFYSDMERRQCERLEAIISDRLLVPTTP